MGRLPAVTGAEVVRALQRAGFVLERRSGSHTPLYHPQRGVMVSVPIHGSRDAKPGTLRGILSDAGLAPEEFARPVRRR